MAKRKIVLTYAGLNCVLNIVVFLSYVTSSENVTFSTYTDPQYVKIGNDCSGCVHNRTDVYTYIESNTTIFDIKINCLFEHSAFAEIICKNKDDCKYYCTNGSQNHGDLYTKYGNPTSYITNVVPQIEKLSGTADVYGARMERGEEEKTYPTVSTVYRTNVLKTDNVTYRYIGCVHTKLFNSISCQINCRCDNLRLNVTHPNTSLVVANDCGSGWMINEVKNDIKIRVWDLYPGCHDNWLPWDTNGNSPRWFVNNSTNGVNGTALYCKNDDPICDNLFIESLARNKTDVQATTIDQYHYTNSKCIRADAFDNVPHDLIFPIFRVESSDDCSHFCKIRGSYQIALLKFISKHNWYWCRCINYDSSDVIHLEPSLKETDSKDKKYCTPCPDDPEKGCGYTTSDDDSENDLEYGEKDDLVSAYKLTENNDNFGFSYYQCIRQPPFNDPSNTSVYKGASELFEENQTNNSLTCLEQCQGFELAIISRISKSNDSEKNFHCKCVNYYKIRMQDIASDCLQWWCPSLEGPCVGIEENTEDKKDNDISSYSTVFCAGTRCDERLLVSNDKVGICDPGETMPEPHLLDLPEFNCSGLYYECRTDELTSLQYWQRLEFVNGQVFNRYLNDSSETCADPDNCDGFDDEGIRWTVKRGKSITIPCTSGLIGNQTWTCQADGTFTPTTPDRSGCVEPWIIDISVKVSNPNITSFNLSLDMLTHLNIEENVSEGGLMELGDIQKELLEKRKIESFGDMQDMGFTKSFLRCNDILLGPKPSWDNMNADQGYEVTSKIIETCSQSGDLYVQTYKNESKRDLVYNGTMMYTEIKMNIDTDSDFCFPVNCSFFESVYQPDGALSRAMIRIPSAIFRLISEDITDKKSSVGTIFNMENGMMPNCLDDDDIDGSDLQKDSFLIQTTLDFEIVGTKVENLTPENEIEIMFKLEENQTDLIKTCVFWNTKANRWDTEGCKLLEEKSNDELTVCSCSHLTNFALIMGNPLEDPNDHYKLDLLSKVLGGISCGLLFITLFCKIVIRPTDTLRHTVEVNRNICLLFGYILFIFVIDQPAITQIDKLCTFITFLTYSIWLAFFLWTGWEGYILYRALVIIFDTGRENKLRLYIFCYIVPFIVSFLNLLPWLIDPDPNFPYHRNNVTGNDVCWVNIERKGDDGSLDQSWTYLIGFYLVLVVMLVANIGILSYGLRINFKVLDARRVKTSVKVKRLMRNCMFLTFMLGITWIFGFPMTIACATCKKYMSLTLEYIFVILNTSTGIFIFINSILFDSKMRETTKLRFQRHSRKISNSIHLSSEWTAKRMNKSFGESIKNWISRSKFNNQDRKFSNTPTIETSVSSSRYRNSNTSDEIPILNLSGLNRRPS